MLLESFGGAPSSQARAGSLSSVALSWWWGWGGGVVAAGAYDVVEAVGSEDRKSVV